MFRSLLAAFALTVLATPVLAQNLALVGPDGQAVALNAAELAALPR